MDVREKLIELLEPHMSGLACEYESGSCEYESGSCEYESGSCELTSCRSCNARNIADHLIANGVTVQEWIPVTERLPEENEYVLIWCGECQIARIEKGISEEQRKAMKNGEINDPVESGWNMSDGYFRLKRSDSYKACDEGWNNKVPYCWRVNGGMMTLFGQNVTHWMPMPEPPKGE